MNYRKDIQILRGISVILVVLYHIGMPGVDSGFLGVDVFFVISGFLMEVLYQPNNKYQFYSRRAKRLLPAYFATIAVTLLVSAIVTIQTEFNQVVEQVVYGSSFASNIGFWMQNSYFSKDEFNPLLHLWSLGVEIQYYLMLPALYWVITKHRHSLFIIILLSVVACFFVLGISPKTSFFMVPFRVWEFLLGVVVAKYFSYNGNIRTESYPYVGGAFIIFLLLLPLSPIDGESLQIIISHPGLGALAISIATAIILALSLPVAMLNSKLGDILELFGKYSYSIYLTHFPIIVLFLYKPFSGTIIHTTSTINILFIIGLISISSVAMFHLIENPGKKINLFRIEFLAVPVLLIIVALLTQQLIQNRYSKEEMLVLDAFSDRSTYRCGKLFRIINPGEVICPINTGIKNHSKKVILVGNSHADSIKTSFANVATKLGILVYFTVGNAPLKGGLSAKAIVQQSKKYGISDIVLHFSAGFLNIQQIDNVIRIAQQSSIKVHIIMPVPSYSVHIPSVLWDNLTEDGELPSQTIQEYRKKNLELIVGMEKLRRIGLGIYHTAPTLCPKNCRLKDSDGRLAYFDGGHLTLSGATILEPVFENLLLNILE